MKVARRVFLLLLPTIGCGVTVTLLGLLANTFWRTAGEMLMLAIFIVPHLLAVIYSVLFYTRRLDSPFVLPASFLLVPLVYFAYETLFIPEYARYVTTVLLTLWFAIPCATVSAIISIAIARRHAAGRR